MMKITPICNCDIIGRYRKQSNTLVDTFENRILLRTKNKARLNKKYQEVNRVGMINAKILDGTRPSTCKLLYVLI